MNSLKAITTATIAKRIFYCGRLLTVDSNRPLLLGLNFRLWSGQAVRIYSSSTKNIRAYLSIRFQVLEFRARRYSVPAIDFLFFIFCSSLAPSFFRLFFLLFFFLFFLTSPNFSSLPPALLLILPLVSLVPLIPLVSSRNSACKLRPAAHLAS